MSASPRWPVADFILPGFDLDAFVRATLAEDLGEGGDITSAAVIPAAARFAGVMDSRDPIVVAGLPIAEAFFRVLDSDIEIERLVEDGAQEIGRANVRTPVTNAHLVCRLLLE